MKSILGSLVPAVLAILVISAAVSAETVDQTHDVTWLSQYGAARKASSQARRPVFLIMTLDNCVHCVRMKNDMQRNDTVVRRLKKDFVPLIVNGAHNPVLARELRVDIYPTTVIIAPDGKVLDYMRGYVPPHSLSARMSTAVTAESQKIARRMDK